MRKIALQELEIEQPGFGGAPAARGKLRFVDAMMQIIAAKQGGIGLAELRQASHILDVLEAASKRNATSVLLEESDWLYLKSRLEAHRFPYANAAFVILADTIISAEAIDPNSLN